MPASPIASKYPLNEQWAPLVVYGKRASLRRKLRGQHKHAKRNAMKVNNRKRQTAHAQPLLEPVGKATSRMDHATIYSREDENNMLNSLAHSFSVLRERCIRFLGQRR